MERFKLRRLGRAARETLLLVGCSLDSDTRLTPSDPVAADGCRDSWKPWEEEVTTMDGTITD